MVNNPILNLQKLITVPIIKNTQVIFQPSSEILKKTEQWFMQVPGTRELKRITKAKFFDQCPAIDLPEIAFVGRSNAGKSSLIQGLFNNCLSPPTRNALVTSKLPGKTRHLNFYTLGKNVCFVDMPGYGENMPPFYEELVEPYLKERTQLRRIFFLIDGHLGLADYDKLGLEMLEECGKPYCTVFTKIDVVKPSVLVKNILNYQEYAKQKLFSCHPHPFIVSSKSLEGLPYLRSFICYACGGSV